MTLRASYIRSAALVLFALMVWAQKENRQSDAEWSPRLMLDIVDAETGRPAAARFSVTIDGVEHEPRWLGPHGWRFVSVHVSKRQTLVVTYARGTGPVEVPLRPGAKSIEVRVAKGLDYVPVKQTANVERDLARVRVELRRWNRLREGGWRAADPHLHYDRIRPEGDRDWLDAMDADGLTHTHFLLAKGGMVPGEWANQFAYGRRGEGADGERLIVAGEEYRDQMQGHLLLYGLGAVVQPIMAGTADAPQNWPPAVEVLNRSRQTGGIAGVAHGGSLGQSPTVIADALLGGLDFMELGNLFQWTPEQNWYPLLNCGYIMPPTGGSDLPNVPYRDWWQPFLGSIRTYVKTGGAKGSDAWNAALKRGEVFVSSGPSIRLTVNGVGPGGRVELPAGGGEVTIEADLESPRTMRNLELVENGRVAASAGPGGEAAGDPHEAAHRKSAWLAARGIGAPLPVMQQEEVAHTGVVQVIVGGRRIWSAPEADRLSKALAAQRELYRRTGKYAREEDRQAMTSVFDRAIGELAARGDKAGAR